MDEGGEEVVVSVEEEGGVKVEARVSLDMYCRSEIEIVDILATFLYRY